MTLLAGVGWSDPTHRAPGEEHPKSEPSEPGAPQDILTGVETTSGSSVPTCFKRSTYQKPIEPPREEPAQSQELLETREKIPLNPRPGAITYQIFCLNIDPIKRARNRWEQEARGGNPRGQDQHRRRNKGPRERRDWGENGGGQTVARESKR